MGFWKNLFNTNESKIQKLITYISNDENYRDKQDAINYLNDLVTNEGISSFCGEDVLCDIVDSIIKKDSSFDRSIKSAKKLYKIIVFDEGNAEQVQIFNKIFNFYLSNEFNISDMKILYNLFNDKKILLLLIDYLYESRSDYIIKYIKLARQYYVDEQAFLSAIVEVHENLSMSYYPNEVIQSKLKEDKINAGIIEFDTDKLDENYKKITKLSSELKECIDEVKILKKSSAEVDENLEKKMNDVLNSKISLFINQTNESMKKAKKENESIKTLADSEKKSIANHADNYLQLIDQKLGLLPQGVDPFEVIESDEVETPVNKFLDPKVPFKDRIDLVKSAKDPKKLYHYTFDRILNQILMNKPVMLVGPSGSGKSYTAKQLANLLGVRLYNFGFVADEITTIKGYTDYQGNFVETPFYEIYKNGGLCFFDEVDNSESKALMELNKIIGSNGYEPYLFPNGEIVTPHPNFRIIAAGNTWGDGADALYSTREKLDAATMNRFASISYGYDKKIEKAILKDYLYMYEFTTTFRDYIENRKFDDVISTRDMEDIKQYLDNDISMEEILDIKFIKNKRTDVLNAISSYLDENLDGKNNANIKFKSMIKNRRA